MTQSTFVFDGHLTAVEPLTVTIKNTQGRLPRNGGFDAPAYWPATTTRGSLRHAAHRVVLMFNEDNQRPPFDLAEHFMLAQGVDIVGDISAPADDEVNSDRHLREGNPMLSLFGIWGLPSKANIGNGFPITANATAMFGGGARTIMLNAPGAPRNTGSVGKKPAPNHFGRADPCLRRRRSIEGQAKRAEKTVENGSERREKGVV